jgi:hypothetical protein
MMNTTGIKSFRPILLIFIITNALFLSARSMFDKWSVDTDVMIIGNLVLFLATAVSFYLYTRSMHTKNAHAILRTMYGSIMSKMIICLVAAFIYISVAGKSVNKGGIFGCMFLYLLYSFIEVAILMKLSKQNKHV